MGGFATHAIFGREILEKIPDEEMRTVIKRHPGVFGIGCQGPDLFLYNIPMLLSNEEKNLGNRMQREGSSRYFAWLLQTIWEAESLEFKEVGISYLYGALAHYTLDSMIHPYVYARIGYDASVRYAKKATSGQHHRLESAIDAKMIAVKEDKLPSEYSAGESLVITRREKKFLAKLLSETVSKSYRIGLRKENVTAAIRMMKILAWGFFAPSVRQKQLLQKVENHFLKDYGLSNFMVTDDFICKRRIMNTRNCIWYHPWKKERTSRDSVWEIYDRAVEQYQEYCLVLEPVAAYLWETGKEQNGSRDAVVKREIYRAAKGLGNLSYSSGLPLCCRRNRNR